MFAKIEKTLKPYEHQLVIAVSIIFALITRFRGINFVSYDMGIVFTHWYNYIRENGGFFALKEAFYNYNPPYIYLLLIATYVFKDLSSIIAIKLMALPFDFLAAFLAYKIVAIKYPKSRKTLFAFIFVLFSPTVVTNGMYWGQNDIIYTSFLLASLYCLLMKKELLALICFSIAVSFKLQAMFFAPVLFILWLKRYLKWESFLIIPVVYYIMLLPAYWAGRSMDGLLKIYFGQMNSDEYLTILAPTFYQWISNEHFELFSKLGLVLAAAVILIFSFILYQVKFQLTTGIIIQIALISVIIMPFFLPKMHERYFFAADLISIIFAFYYPRYFWIPIVITLSSLICYYPAHTTIILFPLSYLSFVMLGVIVTLIFHLAQTIKQQKNIMTTTITNYYQINDNIATSGQPTPEQFEDIAKAGYEIVINLALPTSNNALANEGAVVTRLGMTYIHIPVIWEAPKLENIQQFFKIIESVKGSKIWVHCAMNMRVSCFMYLFQKYVLKLSEEQSRYPMVKIWQPQGVWQEFIQAVAQEFN